MKSIYAISKGQLITLWVFGALVWWWAINGSCNWYAQCLPLLNQQVSLNLVDALAFTIPFILIFYTIGWYNHKKS